MSGSPWGVRLWRLLSQRRSTFATSIEPSPSVAFGGEWRQLDTPGRRKFVADTENWAEGLTDEESGRELQRRRADTPEQWEEIRRRGREKEEAWRRRVFDDREPFPIPEIEADS